MGGDPLFGRDVPIDQLRQLVGRYDFSGEPLQITLDGRRLRLSGRGEKPFRMVPIDEQAFWIENLQAGAVFERDGDKVKRVVFVFGGKQFISNSAANHIFPRRQILDR